VSRAPTFLESCPVTALDNVVGLTGLEQVPDDRVAQVMEPEGGKPAVSTDRQEPSHFFAGLVGS
jgi:hypothetical protein